MDGVSLVDTWHLIAGLVGAFGNQVLYWRDGRRQVNRRNVLTSASYVVTGSGVGFFVGVSMPAGMSGWYLMSLGAGGFWPETVRSLNAARRISKIMWNEIKGQLRGRDRSQNDSVLDENGDSGADAADEGEI